MIEYDLIDSMGIEGVFFWVGDAFKGIFVRGNQDAPKSGNQDL